MEKVARVENTTQLANKWIEEAEGLTSQIEQSNIKTFERMNEVSDQLSADIGEGVYNVHIPLYRYIEMMTIALITPTKFSVVNPAIYVSVDM